MVLFKINGERNSGTMFLTDLMKANFGSDNVYVHRREEGTDFINGNRIDTIYHWKHGVPHNSVKELDDCVVDIFIFRELTSWTVSMFHNVYHLQRNWHAFPEFLTKKLASDECLVKDFRTNRWLNEEDTGKTIFDIRYFKFQKIMDYKEANLNVVLVNLSFLQNEANCRQFLEAINQTYQLGKTEFKTKMPYSKSKDMPWINHPYNINPHMYQCIYDQFQDPVIEDFINHLTFDIKE